MEAMRESWTDDRLDHLSRKLLGGMFAATVAALIGLVATQV
jgi:hypothetical protein